MSSSSASSFDDDRNSDLQNIDSSNRKVVHKNDIKVEPFHHYNKIERDIDVNETTEQLLSRAFTMCLKSYTGTDCDPRSKGIVLVKNAFPDKVVPSEVAIDSNLAELWEIQNKNKLSRRNIMGEGSRHRVIYRGHIVNENHRELEKVFGPMQDSVVKTIKAALQLLNGTSFCKKNDLDYHIRYIEKTNFPTQELISSLGVPEGQESAKQTCHIDFPSLNGKGMSCFLSASNGTKLEVLHGSKNRRNAKNQNEVLAADLDTSNATFLSIEYDRTDFLIMRGDWPHRGTNYIR